MGHLHSVEVIHGLKFETLGFMFSMTKSWELGHVEFARGC